jgi:hypothetical protein
LLSSGIFTGVCSLSANVSEHPVCSIFIGGRYEVWLWLGIWGLLWGKRQISKLCGDLTYDLVSSLVVGLSFWLVIAKIKIRDWSQWRLYIPPPRYPSVSIQLYRVIKKSPCTWWLQYRKLLVMFNVSPASLTTWLSLTAWLPTARARGTLDSH